MVVADLCRRFGPALSFVLIALLIPYMSFGTSTVVAADNPKPAETEPLDIPGEFKDLPDATDAITSKRVGAANSGLALQTLLEKPDVDVEKGVINTDERDLLDFHATAYCLKGRTASGQFARPGIIAADPRVLPLGTVVHLRAGRYTGTYTVLDTGGRIRGRLIDVYVPTYKEAKAFGKQRVKLKVVGRGTRAGKNLTTAEVSAR